MGMRIGPVSLAWCQQERMNKSAMAANLTAKLLQKRTGVKKGKKTKHTKQPFYNREEVRPTTKAQKTHRTLRESKPSSHPASPCLYELAAC
mmetsp:Transcript_97444/g.203386  ORF Transcript_97444/g.203386 Transcript_97444/m.203386 type:complete len:91 (+) Transcript_97444:680-952(+)